MARLFQPFVRSRAATGWLMAAFLVACAGFALSLATRSKQPYPLKETQLDAARLMVEAETRLKEALLAENIAIETDLDPNGTGLIGPEFTALTTTLGTLEAKRTSLDPNFAALMVLYFHEAGLSEGDLIAIGASGSFPGLTIATLCAAHVMGLEALTIASFGSSMYGATRPEFTTPKMQRILADASLIPWSLVAVSPGSDFDHGENPLFDDSRALIARLAREAGVEFIDFDEPDLEASIARRLELLEEKAGEKEIKCFVNIGGASPNSGVTSYTLDFPQGLVMEPPRIPAGADRGLIYEFASRGVPVINLLNIRLLADENGLPWDPMPLPSAGQGGVYEEVRYNKVVLLLTICAIVSILALSRRRTIS